jgi:hypothetical protein
MLFVLVRIIVLSIPVMLLLSQTQATFGLFENLFGPELTCLSKKDVVSKAGYFVYDNKEHKVQIQYPSDWTKEENNGKYTSGDSTLYTLATFQPDTADGFKTTLELEINDISNYPEDLKTLKGLADFEKENVLILPDNSVLSSHDVLINSCPAYEIVYVEGILGKQDQWKSILTFLIDCNKEYVMRYTGTDSDLYDKYLDIVGNMIQTFHVSEC